MKSKRIWTIAIGILVILVILAITITGASKERVQKPSQEGKTLTSETIREAAVAGLFYPQNQETLAKMIDGYLEKAKKENLGKVRAVVCPHAGYEFSGQTAAHCFKQLMGQEIDTVIILGPSHYAGFNGAAIPNAKAFRTPLGEVRLSEKALTLAKTAPFALDPPAMIQRPQWASQSPKRLQPNEKETPHTWEHSVEVEIPFLQRALKHFTIIPVVMGQGGMEHAAAPLAKLLDNDKTALVVSSDLSHYHPYDMAKRLDGATTKAVCDLDIPAAKGGEACGLSPVVTLMEIAKQKGWKTKLLDYRNSGDVMGDRSAVVGYAAIAFFETTKQEKAAHEEKGIFSHEDRKFLLELARKTLREVVTKGRLPEINPATLPKTFKEKKGCFVTLTIDGNLRGCIGHIFPEEPLYQAVIENARSAAIHDPRFSAVRPEEVDKIEIEVSVLTVPAPLAFTSPEDLLAKLQPHKDGVVLKIGPRQATYLPQVWEQLPQKEYFLSSLSQKTGLPPDAWKTSKATVLIYHAEAFKESEM